MGALARDSAARSEEETNRTDVFKVLLKGFVNFSSVGGGGHIAVGSWTNAVAILT